MRRSAILVLAAILQAGCIVDVKHTDDPTAAFRSARAEALLYQGRPGPAHELNVLVYDPGDREMVRVSVPMWLARKAAAHVDWDDADGRDRDVARRVRRHVRLEDVERAGLGILAEVEDGEGEQVLVWLR
jgi:hypothetical protein